MNGTVTDPITARLRIDEVRDALAESRRELDNRHLFKITRECIAVRIRKLELELARLEFLSQKAEVTT